VELSHLLGQILVEVELAVGGDQLPNPTQAGVFARRVLGGGAVVMGWGRGAEKGDGGRTEGGGGVGGGGGGGKPQGAEPRVGGGGYCIRFADEVFLFVCVCVYVLSQ